MGRKLEHFAELKNKIKSELTVISGKEKILEHQKPYINLAENMITCVDDEVMHSIQEVSDSHHMEVRHTEHEKAETSSQASILADKVKAEILKIEEETEKVESISASSHDLEAYRNHLAKWRKLLEELEGYQEGKQKSFMEKIKSLTDGNFQLESSSMSELQKSFDSLSVQSQGLEWFALLPQHDKESIMFYTAENYKKINGYLRGLSELPPENEAVYISHIRNIHRVLSAAHTEHDITVYRGVVSTKLLGEYQDLPDSELVGKVVCDNAFMSTSFDMSTARGFGPYVFEISVPAGSKGAYLGHNSRHPSEDEFLLDINQMFRIDSIEKAHGFKIFHVSLL